MIKFKLIPALFFMILLIGCAARRPTISHVHIGHTLLGWVTTPNKQGLFVVAEKRAQDAHALAKEAANTINSLDQIKTSANLILQEVNPAQGADNSKPLYGVKQALKGSINHMIFAATSDDTTSNVKNFIKEFETNATAILDRCDLITELGKEINATSSLEDAAVFAAEILTLTGANISGIDADGDGVVGSDPNDYGLAQLRRDIENMLDREDPPYTTVGRWYLFNLIRLPSGKWIFRPPGSHDVGGIYTGP
jgi:hypothetical protein